MIFSRGYDIRDATADSGEIKKKIQNKKSDISDFRREYQSLLRAMVMSYNLNVQRSARGIRCSRLPGFSGIPMGH